MKKSVSIPGIIFFTFWLSLSGFLTYFFGLSIHKEVQTGVSPWMYFVVLFPFCFVMIGVWGLVASITVGGSGRMGSGQQIQSKTEFGKGNSIGGFLFGLPFFLAGAGIMIFLSIVPTVKTVMAMNWERVPAEIISSSIKTNYDSDGNTYKAQVKFKYRYEGYMYESDKYDFIFFATSGYKSVKKKVDSAPVGSEQIAYVNTRNPEEAVLSVRLSWLYLFTFLFGSVFAAVGGGIIFAVFYGGPRGSFAKQTLPEQQSHQGPVILKGRAGGPITRFIGVLIFALLWNSMVVFLFTKEAPMFFKAIFGGIGILLIFGVIHGLLALFNPRPVLEVNSKAACLGDSVYLNWMIRGNTQKIKNFKIWMVGQEEATYRRGTSSYTDRQVFLEQVIEKVEGYPPVRGNQEIKLPQNSMHTWKSSNNKIIWLLKVSGEIEKWPDIKEEYEITVLPVSV